MNYELSKRCLFHSLSILCHNQVVNAILYMSVHEGIQIIYGIANAVVFDTSLRVVVRTYLGRTVTC